MRNLILVALTLWCVGCDSATRTHMQAAESLMRANEELQKTALEYQTVCMELRTAMQSRIDRLAGDSARCADGQAVDTTPHPCSLWVTVQPAVWRANGQVTHGYFRHVPCDSATYWDAYYAGQRSNCREYGWVYTDSSWECVGRKSTGGVR